MTDQEQPLVQMKMCKQCDKEFECVMIPALRSHKIVNIQKTFWCSKNCRFNYYRKIKAK